MQEGVSETRLGKGRSFSERSFLGAGKPLQVGENSQT